MNCPNNNADFLNWRMGGRVLMLQAGPEMGGAEKKRAGPELLYP